jgi:hypothetical protein
MTKWRNAMLLLGLWVNGYVVGLERAEGLTWRVVFIAGVSAMYTLSLLRAWDERTGAYGRKTEQPDE